MSVAHIQVADRAILQESASEAIPEPQVQKDSHSLFITTNSLLFSFHFGAIYRTIATIP